MTSYLFELDHPKDEASSRFVAEIGRKLQQALIDRKAISKITQQEIAARLGIDRSRVNKCFSGFANLSIASLAELCWAMDVEPEIIFHQLLGDHSNYSHPHPPHSLGVQPSVQTHSETFTFNTSKTPTTRVNRAELIYNG